MTPRLFIALNVAVALFSAYRPAAAQQRRPLTVAIFAPHAAFKGPYDLFAFGERLAAFIGKEAGLPVKSVAYAKPRQLEAAIRRGEVSFAVLDPLYLARKRHRVLAVATVDGRPRQRWALYVAAGQRSCSLRGRRLAHVSCSGQEIAFAERVLLGGALKLRRFFGVVQALRDAGNAISAVKLGRADCALAPASAAWGLRRAYTLGWVVNPGFAQIDRRLPASTVQAVVRAITRFKTAGALHGFSAADDRRYRKLAARLGSAGLRPAMVDADPVKIGARGVLQLDEVELALPPLDGYLGAAEEAQRP